MSRKPMLIGSLESQAQRKEVPSSRSFGRQDFGKRTFFVRSVTPRRRAPMCLPPKLSHIVTRPATTATRCQPSRSGHQIEGVIAMDRARWSAISDEECKALNGGNRDGIRTNSNDQQTIR